MSDKITYILEVLDKYSVNTKKFKSEMLGVKKVADSLDKSLTKGFSFNSSLSKTIRETNTLAASVDKVARANQRNATIAINTTKSLGNMRKTLAGAYTPIRFNPELGKYESRNQPRPPSPQNFGGGGGGVSFGGVARAMGYYSLIDRAVGLPREVFQTRREMDSLGATLEAIMPKYNRNISAQEAAAKEMDYLKKTSYDLGLNLNAAKEEYVKFLAASAGKSSLKEVHQIFEAFSKLSTVYQITPQRFGLVMNALSQMTSKGVVSMEELRQQLGDSLPGALSLFGRAAMKARPDLVKTEADFMKLVAAGRVSSDIMKQVAKIIVTDTDLMAGLDKAIGSLNGRANKLSTTWTNLLDNFSKGVLGESMGAGISALDRALQKMNTTISEIGESFRIIGDTKFGKFIIGLGESIGTGASVAGEVVKAPFKAASVAGELIAAGAIGDKQAGIEAIYKFNESVGMGFFNPSKPINPTQNSNLQQEQKIVIEFLNAPAGMSPVRMPQNMSLKKDGTITPAGGSY